VSNGAVRDVKHGYDETLRRVFTFGHPKVVVGVLERDGARVHPNAKNGETILDVLTWAEFGTDDELARSWLRAWWDEAEPRKREECAKLCAGVIAGTRTRDEVLELLGLSSVGEIQARIARGIDPPNAPSTVKAKGSSTPLIATGVARSAISFEVRGSK
jgi:hypothetical protein